MEHILWNTFCGTLRGTYFVEHFTEHLLWNTFRGTLGIMLNVYVKCVHKVWGGGGW